MRRSRGHKRCFAIFKCERRFPAGFRVGWGGPAALPLPAKPLVEIENPEVLRFEADVPEALIDRIRRGEDLAVRIPSIDSEIKGQAAEIAPSADPNSRTFLVRIDLPTVRGLRAGQFGRAAIP